MADASTLAALRARIRSLEGGGGRFGAAAASLGEPAIDAALPWGGLPLGALHEIGGPLASGFTALLAGRLSRQKGVAVWCADATLARSQGQLYGPGLGRFGIDLARLVVARCRDPREVLWAAHEALRSPAVACVVAELQSLDLLAGRRLQLAAEAAGTAGLVLRFGRTDQAPSAAVTRWRVEPFVDDPSFANDEGRCWSLDLWRVKGGVPRQWLVRPLFSGGSHEQALSVVAVDRPRDRPAAAEGPPAGRRTA